MALNRYRVKYTTAIDGKRYAAKVTARDAHEAMHAIIMKYRGYTPVDFISCNVITGDDAK